MFEENLKRITATFFFVVALVFNLYYLKTTHFEFMLSLFHYRMFNASALAYTVMRFAYILLPIFFVVPALAIEKVKRLKITFYIIAVMYIIGNSWIIYFLAENPFSMFNDMYAVMDYLQLNALNFDYLVWDSYDLYGILFSTVEAVIYWFVGYYIDKDAKKATTFYWVSLILSIILPFIYVFVLSGIGSFSSMWLRKNTVIFTSGIFMGISLQIASTSQRLWYNLVIT